MSFKIAVKHNWNKLRLYFSYLLLVFYLTIAFLFLFTDMWADLIPSGRALIGLILLSFGVLRFYVAYSRYKKKHIAIRNIIQTKKENHGDTESTEKHKDLVVP